MSFLMWLLALTGALFWVALPAGVLVMAFFYRGQERSDPEALELCAGYDPTNPAAKPCWVATGDKFCALHDDSDQNVFNPNL